MTPAGTRRDPFAKLACVFALLALFVALSETSYADNLLGKNSVGTKQLKNEAVTSAKVKDGSLLGADFAKGQVPAGPAGAAGPQGPQGTPGSAKAWAFVGGNGVIISSGGNIAAPTVTKVAPGIYTIAGPGWGTTAAPVPLAATAYVVNDNGGNPYFATASAAHVGEGASPVPASVRTYFHTGAAQDCGFLVWIP